MSQTTDKINIDDLPETLEPKHIQLILGIGRRKTYELLEDPPFHIIRLGRMIKIPKRTFLKWYEGDTA